MVIGKQDGNGRLQMPANTKPRWIVVQCIRFSNHWGMELQRNYDGCAILVRRDDGTYLHSDESGTYLDQSSMSRDELRDIFAREASAASYLATRPLR